MTICDTIADAHYGSRPEMAMAFAALLNDEAKELEALGVDVIQFDEPAFNVFMKDVKDWGIEALHRASKACNARPRSTFAMAMAFNPTSIGRTRWARNGGNMKKYSRP